MMIKKLIFLSIFLLFFERGITFFDPDMGWHIRTGELIASGEIVHRDPYSYTMPSFPFVDHEWLSNLIIFRVYQQTSIVGLSIVFSTVATLALWIATRKMTDKSFLFIIIIAFGALYQFFGIRPQVFSWGFLVLLLAMLNNPRKYALFIIILQLLWNNMHGSFPLGIVVISIFVVVKAIQKRSVFVIETILLFLCLATTFVHPYGLGAWREVIMQLTDAALRSRVVEWQTALGFINIPLCAFVALVFALGWRYKKKLPVNTMLLAVFLLVQAIGSVRHVPLFILASLGLLFRAVSIFARGIAKNKIAKERFQRITKIATLGSIAMNIVWILYVKNNTVTEAYYPGAAITFLQSTNPSGELFAHYNWGGYLVWKLPNKRVFIDGRMPSWRWNDQPQNESGFAMEEYLAIINGALPFAQAFTKYGIKTVLWPKFSEQITLQYNFSKDLEQNNWEKIYEDDVAVIYSAP